MGDGWSIIGRKTYQITTGGDLTRRGGFSIRTLFILILPSYTVLNPYKITFVLVQYVFYLFLLEFISDCIVFLVFFLFLNVIGQQLLRSGGDALFRPSASDENNFWIRQSPHYIHSFNFIILLPLHLSTSPLYGLNRRAQEKHLSIDSTSRN